MLMLPIFNVPVVLLITNVAEVTPGPKSVPFVVLTTVELLFIVFPFARKY